jgi:hypothetical protein
MHVRVTGQTGWMGAKFVRDLVANRYQSNGLGRPAAKA